MKIKFEANQQYQLDAIQAAVDIFDGQPLASGAFEIRFDAAGGELFTELGTGNHLELQAEQVLANLNKVQIGNDISPSASLETLPCKDAQGKPRAFFNFSVEMETGTAARPTFTCAASTSCTNATGSRNSSSWRPAWPSAKGS